MGKLIKYQFAWPIWDNKPDKEIKEIEPLLHPETEKKVVDAFNWPTF